MNKKALLVGSIVVILLWLIFRPSVQAPSTHTQQTHMRTDSNTLEAVQAVEHELKHMDQEAAQASATPPKH